VGHGEGQQAGLQPFGEGIGRQQRHGDRFP
jgi:hypothetical protein